MTQTGGEENHECDRMVLNVESFFCAWLDGETFLFNFQKPYLEPVCPLFWWLNPTKQGLFQSKQGSFGFQVRISKNPDPFLE